MQLQRMKKAFTLIELLVVITIIGILATGATTIYTAQIQKARDSTRISDVKALQGAIEQVYQDSAEYPHSDKFATGSTVVSVLTYMEDVPQDPKSKQGCNGGTPCDYLYVTGADANSINYGVFELSTGFENSGNVTSKAATSGNDDYRFELGLTTSSLDTSYSGAISDEGCIFSPGLEPAGTGSQETGGLALIKLDTEGCKVTP